MLAEFHSAHRKRYGHADENRTVEVVNVRLRMIAGSGQVELPRKASASADCASAVMKNRRVMFDGAWVETPVLQRDLLAPGNRFAGPAIVHEYSATTVVPPGSRVRVDEFSNLVIDLS
jgi:N-methylhydantoinase A